MQITTSIIGYSKSEAFQRVWSEYSKNSAQTKNDRERDLCKLKYDARLAGVKLAIRIIQEYAKAPDKHFLAKLQDWEEIPIDDDFPLSTLRDLALV